MKTMPWFRFYSETADDKKFTFIMRALKMPRYAVIGIWSMLECRASQSPIRGYLYVTAKKRFTIDDLAEDVGMELVQFELVMKEFIEMDMVEVIDGVFHLKNWEKRQYSSDNSTQRVKKYREKQACNVSETFPVTGDSASVSDSVSESIVDDLKGKSIPQIVAMSSGLSSIPPKETQRIEQIYGMVDKYGEKKVTDTLKVACDKWVVTRGKSGRFYGITNMGWVDWAQEMLDGNSGGALRAEDMLVPGKNGQVNI